METVWVILKDGHYIEVSHEEYDKFEGEKFMAPKFWRLDLVGQILLRYRYM